MRRVISRFAAAVALTTVAAVAPAAPAMAAYPYHRCQYIGGTPPAVCVGWTGGWPGGLVRAESAATYWATRLDRCANCGGPTGWSWTTVARTDHYRTSTPSVSAGKTSWYKACVQTVQGGRWSCMNNSEAVYLGD
jgi:hypothetical protein